MDSEINSHGPYATESTYVVLRGKQWPQGMKFIGLDCV